MDIIPAEIIMARLLQTLMLPGTCWRRVPAITIS